MHGQPPPMPNDLALGSGSKNSTKALHLVAESQPGAVGGLKGTGRCPRKTQLSVGGAEAELLLLPASPPTPFWERLGLSPLECICVLPDGSRMSGSTTPFPASQAHGLKGPQPTVLPKQADGIYGGGFFKVLLLYPNPEAKQNRTPLYLFEGRKTNSSYFLKGPRAASKCQLHPVV